MYCLGHKLIALFITFDDTIYLFYMQEADIYYPARKRTTFYLSIYLTLN